MVNGNDQVTALLANGLKDKILDLNFTTENLDGSKNDPDAISMVHVGTVIPQGVSFQVNEDGTLTERGMKLISKTGWDCEANVVDYADQKLLFASNETKVHYIYFDIDDRYIFGDKNANVTFEVEYYDMPSGQLKLEYCSSESINNPAYTSRTMVDAMSGKGLTTASITVDTASLNNGQDVGSDFRFGPSPLYIKSAKVTAGPLQPIDRSQHQIFLASDSTCENYPNNYYPRKGWGMEIGKYFNSSVEIVNKAKGGKSTRTFLSGADPTTPAGRLDSTGEVLNPDYDDKRMDDILSQGQPGDYLLIQFGHNDANNRGTVVTQPDTYETNEHSYRYNLHQFVLLARANDMIPIFVTSVHAQFDNGARDYDDKIEPYRQAMREVGATYHVPVLDIAPKHKTIIEHWSSQLTNGSNHLFCYFSKDDYPNYPDGLPDRIHMCETGANEVAKLIASAIQEGAATDETLQGLAMLLNPSADLTPLAPTAN